MKIQKLTIEGFRSLKKVEWSPGDLNVVIGQNASGKSNLIAALELLSASARGRLSDYVISHGGMTELVWDNKAEGICFDAEISEASNLERRIFEYKLDMRKRGNSNNYFFVDESAVTRFASKISPETGFTNLLNRDTQSGMILSEKTNDFEVVPDLPSAETLLSFAGNALGGNHWLPLLKKYQADWSVYNDLFLHQGALMRQSAVTRYEKRLNSDGQNLATVLHTLYTDREFKSEIDLGMRAAFDEYEEVVFLPSASQRIEMGIRWRSLKNVQTAANLSDGTLRFLLLLTVLADSELPPLIVIDEPEIGLHPRMLPIVAEFAIDAARRSQIIFTTHSEAFLDAFREKRPTTTVVGMENGETTLKVVDDEELAYWIKDFTLGDIFRSGTLEHIA